MEEAKVLALWMEPQRSSYSITTLSQPDEAKDKKAHKVFQTLILKAIAVGLKYLQKIVS